MPVLDFIAWTLLVLWASLQAGGLLLRRSRARTRSIPSWIQTASALTLLLMAWYGYLLTRAGTDGARYALGVAAAITFSLIGGKLVAGSSALRRTNYGISLTAVSYLLFAGAIAQYGAGFGSVRLYVLIPWLLAGVLVGRAVLLWKRRGDPLQASAAVAYTLLLFTASGFATGLAITAPRFGVLAVGALLLVFSDLVQLFELSSSPSWLPDSQPSGTGNRRRLLPWSGNATQLLRPPAHALIVVSIWSALQNPIGVQFSVFGA